jgi:hypothetical protein
MFAIVIADLDWWLHLANVTLVLIEWFKAALKWRFYS